LVAPVAVVVGLACAAAVKLTSPGPVLFRQDRVGLDGRRLVVFKFRTMVHDSTSNPLFPDAARITKIGSLLRRTSLDEIPQLINVARGEMSIVGPRPTLAYQVARYDERQRARLSVRPGITGLAQLRGRNSIPWATRIEHDLEYLSRQSLWLDVAILVKSLAAVVRGDDVSGHPLDDPLASPGASDSESS
jgi:lipopolysaccharide/colanic/teichoic acid biosynthesis glycosyltransferase